jgi:hypothetical protein
MRRSLWMMTLLVAGCTASAQQHLNEKRTTVGGNMIVTVFSIEWPNPASPVSADVEVCASEKAPPNTFAFPSYFQLRFADGGAIASYGSRKKPTLERRQLQPADCVRGWLDFAVTSGQKPLLIHYHEPDADNKPMDWPIK